MPNWNAGVQVGMLACEELLLPAVLHAREQWRCRRRLRHTITESYKRLGVLHVLPVDVHWQGHEAMAQGGHVARTCWWLYLLKV